jgi:hypothetical protein
LLRNSVTYPPGIVALLSDIIAPPRGGGAPTGGRLILIPTTMQHICKCASNGSQRLMDIVSFSHCIVIAIPARRPVPRETLAKRFLSYGWVRSTWTRKNVFKNFGSKVMCSQLYLDPSLFPIYSEKAFFWASPRVPARRRRSSRFLALRRPPRRREDGESMDPGEYIV